MQADSMRICSECCAQVLPFTPAAQFHKAVVLEVFNRRSVLWNVVHQRKEAPVITGCALVESTLPAFPNLHKYGCCYSLGRRGAPFWSCKKHHLYHCYHVGWVSNSQSFPAILHFAPLFSLEIIYQQVLHSLACVSLLAIVKALWKAKMLHQGSETRQRCSAPYKPDTAPAASTSRSCWRWRWGSAWSGQSTLHWPCSCCPRPAATSLQPRCAPGCRQRAEPLPWDPAVVTWEAGRTE